ncbi:MAG: LPS export ABC transporter ATP-binding protein [Planctomycetaceae bacterium]|jgi:lipopolysaccharide export system ATP-binding protein|nr:LPS export ABC transporter ATP-binding protein [Planctomycetaceae bacterium]
MLKHTFPNTSNLVIPSVSVRDQYSPHANIGVNHNVVKDQTRPVPVVLRADGLVKIYGKRRVVDGVSFHVNKGEIVGLLGPNGAGKTTSFRMVCGLISSNGGIVHLGPHDITNWPMYRRSREGGMGYLPQDKSVFQKLSVQNNLLAIMEMIGVKRHERMTRCDELLDKFKLNHLRRNMGGSLSGGEKRRLEIARALVSNPKIILLDEPFAAVDPITVTSIQSIIRQLSLEGISILITDHSVQDTLQITHRSYVIRTGQVLCHGTPEEVLSNAEARKVYFGENVSVGKIKSAPLRQNNAAVESTIIYPKENKITPNHNLNNPAQIIVTKNNQQAPTPKIISDSKNINSRNPQNNIQNELFLNNISNAVLNGEKNYSDRPEITPERIQNDLNRKSRIIKTRIETERQGNIDNESDDFITPQPIAGQSSILNNNINSNRPATRRLIPSSSSIIIPATTDRPPVRSTTQNQIQQKNTSPSASRIMKLLGAVFFGKNS